jgi:hypothetical protein
LANPVAAPALGARQFVAGVDQQGERPILHWSRAPVRRLFILRSTVRPSKIQLFGATASFDFHHLSSITIWADDASETVDPEEIAVPAPYEGPASTIV